MRANFPLMFDRNLKSMKKAIQRFDKARPEDKQDARNQILDQCRVMIRNQGGTCS